MSLAISLEFLRVCEWSKLKALIIHFSKLNYSCSIVDYQLLWLDLERRLEKVKKGIEMSSVTLNERKGVTRCAGMAIRHSSLVNETSILSSQVPVSRPAVDVEVKKKVSD